MTQQEILEYNKRCAEFLGLTIITDDISWFDTNYKALKPYHSDWNRIMEIVEAIEKLGYLFDITGNEVGVNSNITEVRNISTGGTMNSYNDVYFPNIISVCEEEYSKKEAVVQAINQFLIFYNEQRT